MLQGRNTNMRMIIILARLVEQPKDCALPRLYGAPTLPGSDWEYTPAEFERGLKAQQLWIGLVHDDIQSHGRQVGFLHMCGLVAPLF